MTSFKNYNIIDYDHNFTLNGEWYMKNLGTPLKVWQNKEDTTYIDIFDVERTVPGGTWWLQSMITNEEAIQEIDNRTLNSYSLTTANKEFADKFMQKYNPLSTKSIPVDEMQQLLMEYGMSFKHRTLIKDIKNPVGFTVSLTGFPCVGGAVFAKKCLETSQQSNKNKGENMTDGINLSFDNLKELLSLKSNKDDNDVYVTKEELQETLKSNNESLSETIGNIIDEKLSAQKDDDKKDDGADKGTDKKDDKKDDGKKDDDSQGKDDKGTDNPGDDGQTANKNNPGSKQIDHKDDGDDLSFKKGTPEYKILEGLGRNANGTSKIKL